MNNIELSFGPDQRNVVLPERNRSNEADVNSAQRAFGNSFKGVKIFVFPKCLSCWRRFFVVTGTTCGSGLTNGESVSGRPPLQREFYYRLFTPLAECPTVDVVHLFNNIRMIFFSLELRSGNGAKCDLDSSIA